MTYFEALDSLGQGLVDGVTLGRHLDNILQCQFVNCLALSELSDFPHLSVNIIERFEKGAMCMLANFMVSQAGRVSHTPS